MAYHADSKHIGFIKFSSTHQKLQAREKLSDFRKKVERKKVEPYYRGFKLTSAKNGVFCNFYQDKDHGCVLICFFFFRGDRIDPVGLENQSRDKTPSHATL